MVWSLQSLWDSEHQQKLSLKQILVSLENFAMLKTKKLGKTDQNYHSTLISILVDT